MTAITATSVAGIVFGVCYVGGREIERTGKPGDTVWAEQAMVHTLIRNEVTGAPVVMVPGMGLGSFIYLGTPDGRKGWAQLFAEAGHPVYVYDIPEYSTHRNIWRNWGFGDETDSPFADVRYPVAQIDQLEKHMPLRYQDLTSQDVAPVTGDVEAEAIVSLCEKIGEPAILMIHSASAAYIEPLLTARPELFNGVINLEQAFITANDEADTVNAFAALLDGIPFLSVYADYIDERGQTNRKALSQAITDAILQRGGVAGFIDLPAQDVFGNTHLMMQDNNNEFIAAQIMDWIDTNVDTQTDDGT